MEKPIKEKSRDELIDDILGFIKREQKDIKIIKRALDYYAKRFDELDKILTKQKENKNVANKG